MLSCRGKGAETPPQRAVFVASLVLQLAWGVASAAWAQGQPVTFSVVGDIPDSLGETQLLDFVRDHNLFSPSEFFVHVGDIKPGSSECVEADYSTIANILAQLAVSTFIVPGDNDWNDCSDPDQAWAFWEAYFMDFEQSYCGTPPVEAQVVRPENFAFILKEVLFIGVHVVGGTVQDPNEWDTRLQQDADWVALQMEQNGDRVRAVVVFGHAGPKSSRAIFFDQLEASSASFGKPVLYIQGHDHSWAFDNPFSEPNMARITVDQNDPPLEVTVTLDPLDPFVAVRDPWPAGTSVLNRPPCVEAGPDQTITEGNEAVLSGFVSDDGVPVGGGLSLGWSQVSGPGQCSIADPNSALTTASFPDAGSYLLRLTADDGELVSLDELVVDVQSGGPRLAISDVSVSEGDAGTSQAIFTVDLLAETGGLVTVDFATTDWTAVAGIDYQTASGSLSFSGATTQRTISVLVNGDLEPEEPETFLVTLTNAVGADIADGVGTGLIVDDDTPLAPIVSSFAPASGTVGALVSLTGQSFSGVSSVTFNGTPAPFSVVSDTRIDAFVPEGASSGPLRVTNAAGTGASASDFVVEYRLVLATIGSGAVDLQPPAAPGDVYAQGTLVTLTPLPSPGWEFLAWSGDLGGFDNPAAITMDADATVVATFVETGTTRPVSLSVRVASGNDDAEEKISSGSVKLTSSDLELGEDKMRPQLVGLRFANVSIPQGATILSASVLFTVDEQQSAATSIEIRGEASDHAAPFSTAAFDVSARPTTAAVATWNPPAWTAVGAAGDDQRTPELALLVQEIVGRSGWVSGNALVLVVAGTGARTADSFDGNPGGAPVLDVVYLDTPDLEKPSTPQNLGSPAQTGTTIELAWDAATDNVGVTGYRVYGPNGTTDVTGTSHVETGLAPNTVYGFQVSALDAAGNESDPSPVLNVQTTAPDLEKPSTPQNLGSPAQTGTTIELAWDAATDNVGVTGYRVYGPNGTTDVTGTSHVETGLAPNTVYGFQVSALDAAGNESEPSPVLSVQTGASEPVSLSVRVASGNDDAEEKISSGSVKLTSGDLELGEDEMRPKLVGLRFASFDVPRGATITRAHLQFTAEEVRSDPTSLVIWGEASGHAAPFSTADFDLSTRPITGSSVGWSPGPWLAIGEAGQEQRTDDFAAVVQEIVDHPGWSAGNAIVLLISGSGSRVAESYDGSAPDAAELVVGYLP